MKQEKIVAVIQARMGSSRLPGKAMKEVAGHPMLGQLINRLRLCKNVDEIIVATSRNSENDILESFCHSVQVKCYRGSENDVLERMTEALQSCQATIGVEIFGDCPLIDPKIVDQFIKYFLEDFQEYDFVSNDLETSYPPGMEVEVFKLSSLEDSHSRAIDPKIREHGTLFIRQNPTTYKIHNITAPDNLKLPHLELEVDTQEDLDVIRHVFDFFHPRNDFSLEEIIAFANNNPEIFHANQDIPRKWKEFRNDK